MSDDYDRDDRRERTRDRDERRPMRVRRRFDRDRETPSSNVSVLGVIALIKGILALVLSMVPCFGAFAIFAASFALLLAIASVLVARSYRHGMGFPVAATVVSGSAVAFSLMWMAMAGAMFRGPDERATAVRTAPLPPPPPAPPRMVPTTPAPVPVLPPKKIEENTKVDDEKFQKQLLEDLAKDRVKEAIRNGPGIPVTAEKLDQDYRTNVVAAELKYKDKVLEVTGAVVRITHDDGQPHYTLELETGANGKTIDCDFTAQTKHPLASLERGQSVKVRGLCTGRDNGLIRMKDCVVAK